MTNRATKWAEVRVGDLGQVFTGRTPSTKSPEYFGDEFFFITPGDMHQGKHVYATERSLSNSGANLLRRIQLPPKSICVSCIGWQMGEVVMTSATSFTNQQINSIVPNGEVDADFLYYSFLPRKQELLSLASAIGVRTPILNKSGFCDLRIVLPPLLNQRKIASILSAYDDLIENNMRRIKILDAMVQNLYREWFVKFRFPGHQKSRFTDSTLGRIPVGWEVVSVEQIVKRVPSGKKYDQKTVSATGTVPVLDQGKSGIIGYHDDEPGVLASEDAPIIVFANHTCYQRLVMFAFSAIQNVLPFVPSSEYPRNIYWLHYATKNLVSFNDYKGHWPEFMAKELILPSSNACKRFGGFVEPVARLICKIEMRNATLRRTRDLLLPKLISGEVDVTELDIAVPEEVVL